jgi:hypothetical protein
MILFVLFVFTKYWCVPSFRNCGILWVLNILLLTCLIGYVHVVKLSLHLIEIAIGGHLIVLVLLFLACSLGSSISIARLTGLVPFLLCITSFVWSHLIVLIVLVFLPLHLF